MKKTWLAMFSVLLLAVLLVACGGGDDNADNNTGTNDGGTTDTEQTDEGTTEGDTGATADADAAEASYQQACSSCHGGNLEGLSGPQLSDVGSRLSQDEILDAILNGRPGMPPGLLQGDEAENVAAWLAEQK